MGLASDVRREGDPAHGPVPDFHEVFLRLFTGDNLGKLILDISA